MNVIKDLLEIKKPSRYKEEPKKPWILAYYALMRGTQKRQQKLKTMGINNVDKINQAPN